VKKSGGSRKYGRNKAKCHLPDTHDIASSTCSTFRIPTYSYTIHKPELKKRWYSHIWFIGKKIYGLCGKCDKVVRINKPLFGSFHLCR